jgi:hypothetical protein
MKSSVTLFIAAAMVCLVVVLIGGCRWQTSEGVREQIEKPALEAIIPLLSTVPVINGKFDEKEWEKASWVSGFVTLENEWAEEQSSVFMATDGKYLYLAMKCLKNSPFAISAKKHSDDSMDIFGDESVEIFIAPGPEQDVYYHFAINAVGSVYNAKCSEGKRDESWNPKIEVECKTFDGGWILESKIDLSSMGTMLRLNDKLKMNFARNNSSLLGMVSSSWTGQDNFNEPRLFGSCIVAPNGGIGYSAEKIDMSAVNLVVRNADREPRACNLAIQSELGSGKKELTLKPFSNTPVSVALKASKEAKGEIKLAIEFGDSQSTSIKTAFLYEYSAIFSVTPSLYYCTSGETISSKIDSHLEKVDSIKITVTGPEQNGPHLRTIMLKLGEKSFSFDTKGMKPGRHVISAAAMDAKGKILDSDDKIFIVVMKNEAAPLPEKQQFELDGKLIKMNGELFFPFMTCDSPKETYSALDDGSFNVRYGNIGVRKNAALLATCGYPVAMSWVGGTHYEAPEKEKVFEHMKSVIEKSGNANVFCRRLQYEAGIPLFRKQEGVKALAPVSAGEEYTDCYKFLKKIFPGMLVSIQNDRGNMPDFVGCADIIEVATPASYSKKIMRDFVPDLEKMRAIVGDKPLLLWIGASIPSADFRNAENIRAATWLAVFGGANGVIYHTGHSGIPDDRTRLWSVFKNLGCETEVLYPIAVSQEKLDPGFSATCDLPFIILSARKFKGDTYVMAVSKALGTTKARIRTGLPATGVVEVVFENRSIKINNGEVEDSFTSFEPHLYRIKTF